MIATINTIFYILSVSEESINSGTVQKGTAISRIDDNDGFQIYKYSNFLTDSNENLEAIPFEDENMYLISGKFSVMQDNSINITIITSIHIPLDKDDIPAMKPTVHLLGKSMDYAKLSEAGYSLQIQVKPYLSKEQFKPYLVNLTHPPNGRFKNALIKAKKNSTIHTTGLFFLANNELYCEILEFQFVAASKTETESSISVPWKSKTVGTSSSSPISAIERRIDTIRQSVATSAPSSAIPSAASPTGKRKNKRKGGPFSLRISEISKSLQNQPVEISDSDQEKDDDVVIIEHEEDEKEDDCDTPIATRKSKRKRNNK